MKRIKWLILCLSVFLALALNSYAGTATAPTLGEAGTFAVLAGSGITSADSGTTIVGNVGSSPTPTITGLIASQVTGTLYNTAPVVSPTVTLAQTNLVTAYNAVAGETPCTTITGGTLGAGATLPSTLVPGIYCGTSSVLLNGTLTLAGGPTDVWIFQIGSSLTTGTGATIAFTGGASPCNVFWQVGSSATIQTGNSFAGNIMALTSITLDGGTLTGRALARNGAVTISGQETIISGCSTATPTIVLSPGTSSSVCGSGATTTETATVLSNGVPVVGASVTFTITSGPGAGTYGPFITGALGTASFTVPALALLSPADSIEAQFTQSSVTYTSNVTTVSCVAPVVHDTTPPTVTLLSTTTGPPKEVILSLQDTGSGLGTVTINTSTNATTVVAPFIPGTIGLVGVTATKINQSESAEIELTVTDRAGNKTVFDPVFATITIPASNSHTEAFNFHHEEVARYDGISRTEGVVLLQNGTPGVDLLVISVNGSVFRTHLSDGETTKLDISSALYHGNNEVTVAAFGKPNSSVDLTISDGK